MTSDAVILAEPLQEGVVRLTFNRPRAANSINQALADEWVAQLQAMAADDAVKAIILTGAGERVFCAGVDLKNPDGFDRMTLAESRRQRVTRALEALLNFEKPVVAALNGVASGAGVMLALLCDIVLADDQSYLQMPEIDVGMPTFLGFEAVKFICGEGLAADLVLSGRRMPFPDAATAGLIRAALPADRLAVESERLAAQLAAKPALPYALNKRWINQHRRRVLEAAAAESLRVQSLLHSHHDAGQAASDQTARPSLQS